MYEKLLTQKKLRLYVDVMRIFTLIQNFDALLPDAIGNLIFQMKF